MEMTLGFEESAATVNNTTGKVQFAEPEKKPVIDLVTREDNEVATPQEASNVPAFSYETMTPEEQRMIDEFVEKIDVSNSQQILHYGSAAQKKINSFSDKALEKVQNKDLGPVGDHIVTLSLQLKKLDKPKTRKTLFGKVKSNLEQMKSQYRSVEGNVNGIVDILQNHSNTLESDMVMLQNLYELNLEQFRELGAYIIAGNMKIAQIETGELTELRERAQKSGDTADAQLCKDLEDKLERFRKKIHDLELTRHICLQMGMQIRMSQNSDDVMIQKISTTIANTIPLWKSQMLLAFGLEHSRQAAAAQKVVTDMTNEILLSNAELMHDGTVSIAQEAERSIVEIETLVKTNDLLIQTLDEVKVIHDEGRKKRSDASRELARLENDLKRKLLEASITVA